MALALFALAGWGGVAPQTTPVTHAAAAHFSSGGPVINWDSSMIYAGQNNGNPEGPVGEQAKVNGSGFSAGNDVNVVLAPGDSTFNPATCQSSNDVGIANDVTIQSDGTFSLSFTWPHAASEFGSYSICALDPSDGSVISNEDGGPFTVLSPDPPAIQVSTTQVAPGNSVTITGSNFDPSQAVNVLIASCHNCGASPIASTTTNSDGSGNFSATLTIPGNATPGGYVATAFTQNGVLDVGLIGGAISITVTQPSATATPTPNPTVTASTTASATATTATTNTNAQGSNGNSNGSDNTPYIIGITVAVVVLLAALGAGIFFLLRRRQGGALGPTGGRRAPPPAREGGYGAYGGGYGASGATTSGQYTPPGGYTPATGTTTGPNTPPDWRILPTWDGSQTAGLSGGVTPGGTPPPPTPTSGATYPADRKSVV